MARIILLFFAFIFLRCTAMFSQCPVTANAGPDKYLCAPATSALLNGSTTGTPLSVFWTPATGLNNPNIPTPTATVSSTTTYTFHATAIQWTDNLIVNGDFEAGNTNFTSSYNYSPGDVYTEGTYDVVANPANSHPDFSPCSDHTAAPGTNMMVVNGTGNPNTVVWCQTVPVTANTQYAFSAWAASAVSSAPAILQIFVNGVQIGNTTTLSSATCVWSNLTAMWNSGGATSAAICIVNQNTALSGNDFIMDDLVFAPSCESTDEMTVHVISLTATASPIVYNIPCEGSEITLNASGSSSGPNITYNWMSLTGNIVSGGNTLTPVVDEAGIYTLVVTYSDGNVTCTKNTSVNVVLDPNGLMVNIFPPGQLGCDPPEITLSALANQPNNQLSYSWNTANGNIVSGDNTSACVVDAAGTYTVTATNTINGCTSVATVNVSANAAYPTSIATGSAIGCLNPNTIISGAGSSVGPGIIYTWSTTNGSIVSGINSINPTVGAPGIYTLTVLNQNNGCASTDTAIVVADANFPVAMVAAPGDLDCNNSSFALNGSVTPGNATFIWTTTNGGNIQSGSGTLNPVINTAGTYNLIATNPLNGCKDTATIVITSNTALPVAVATVSGALDCNNSSVTLSSAGSSSGSGFQILWTTNGGNISGANNTSATTATAAGMYILTINNTNNGCIQSDTVQVTLNQSNILAVANVTGTINCINSQVTLNGAGSSTGAGISYTWTTADGNISSAGNGLTATATAAGTYQLLVSNSSNGCSNTAAVTVTADLIPPVVSINPPASITCVQTSGTLICNFSNGSFSWTATGGGNIVSGSNTGSPVYNAPGNYCVTVTNMSNGCTNTACATVTANTNMPVAMASVMDTINCQNASVQLFSAGSSSGQHIIYNWTTTNGNVSGGDNSAVATVNAAGNYTLQVTDTLSGCADTAQVSVLADVNAVVAVANTPGQLDCDTDTLTLNANGSSVGLVTYVWTTPDGAISSGANSANPVISAPGTYILLLTNTVNACASTDTVQVTSDLALPVVVAVANDSLGCNTSSVTLSSTGSSAGANFAYLWTTVAGNIVSGDVTPAPVVSAAGSYTLQITNTTNGCVATDDVTVVADGNVPVAAIAPVNGELNCAVSSLSLNAGASSSGVGISYSWTTSGGGNIFSGGTSLFPVVDAAGSYTLTVTNQQNQCTATATAVVAADTEAPVILPVGSGILTCSDPDFLLEAEIGNPASGTMAFLWQTTNGNITGNPANATVLCDAAGFYSVTVTNTVNQCTATANTNIGENLTIPVISIDPPGVITCAQSEVLLQANSDISDVTWSWTTANGGQIVSGGNTSQPLVDEPGDYLAQAINNANGCTSNDMVTVIQNAVFPQADAGNPAVLNCNMATITLSGTGETGPDISYLWQTSGGTIVSGASTLTPVISAAGDYTLYVSNQATGCTGSATVQITADLAAPTADAGSDAILDCGTTGVLLDGSGSDIGAGFSYLWTTLNGNIVTGANTLNPEINAPGSYILSVTNTNNGCTAVAAVNVINDANAPLADAGLPDTLTCTVGQITLSASASAGSGIIYEWTTANGNIISGNNTLFPVVDAPGTYVLTVLNTGNGCNTLASVAIAENTTLPTVDAGLPQEVTCAATQIALQGNTNIAAGNYTAQWTSVGGNIVSNANTLTPTVNLAGLYTLSITDIQNGCVNSGTVAVTTDTISPAISAMSGGILTCVLQEVGVTGIIGLPPTDYSVTWSALQPGGNISGPVDQLATTVTAAGSYQILIENNINGCTNSTTLQVSEDTALPVAEAGISTLLTCTATTVTLDGSGSDIGPEYVYNWTSLDGTGIVNGVGTLTPTVNEAGNYALLVTNTSNGCTATDQVTVGADQVSPTAGIDVPGSLTCLQNSVLLDAGASTAGPGIQVLWTDPAGLPFLPPAPYSPIVTAAGQYTVLVLNTANGCTATAVATVVADLTAPDAEAGPSGALHCQQPAITLQGSSTTTGASFSWATTDGNILSGNQSATPVVSLAGAYILTVTNPVNGCTATDVVQIIAIPLPEMEILTDQPDCFSPTGSAVIANTTGGTAPFTYGIDGVYQSAPDFLALAPGVYMLSVLDANGCTDLQSIEITTPFELTVSLEVLQQLTLGEQVQLAAALNVPDFQISEWEWSPAEGLSCTDCPSPIASPLTATNYSLTVTDINGCTADALTQVLVVADREIFAPNIFSPNGDGSNEYFTIFGKALSQINTLRIYDRWGNQLFQKDLFPPNDQYAGWDGYFQGKIMPAGVYVWYAEIAFVDGLILPFKGDVTIVR